MTANELASEIQNCEDDYYNLDAATMLRQQAKEIEALKLRELTDEEIMQVWEDSEWGDGEQEDILLFAKALLKKAGEK
jgi:hypothetical protein